MVEFRTLILYAISILASVFYKVCFKINGNVAVVTGVTFCWRAFLSTRTQPCTIIRRFYVTGDFATEIYGSTCCRLYNIIALQYWIWIFYCEILIVKQYLPTKISLTVTVWVNYRMSQNRVRQFYARVHFPGNLVCYLAWRLLLECGVMLYFNECF